MNDYDRDDETVIAAASLPGGLEALRWTLLGAALEIAAFAVLLLSERLKLPLTFALFGHLNAVFFFTRGFDRRLVEIRLRRELVFFFALIFPLAGMVGIVFFILVLKNLEPRLNLTDSAAAQAGAPPASDEAALFEEDYLPSLSSSFVRRVGTPLAHHEAWHAADAAFPVDHYREKEYWRREQELASAIRERERDAGETVDPEAKRLLADLLIEYVSLFQADPRLREHYLDWALDLCRETGDAERDERTALERIVEIDFQSGRYKECASGCAGPIPGT
jgi:hypothetical protein